MTGQEKELPLLLLQPRMLCSIPKKIPFAELHSKNNSSQKKTGLGKATQNPCNVVTRALTETIAILIKTNKKLQH